MLKEKKETSGTPCRSFVNSYIFFRYNGNRSQFNKQNTRNNNLQSSSMNLRKANAQLSALSCGKMELTK